MAYIYSKSGNTREVLNLIVYLKQLNIHIVGVFCNPNGNLIEHCHQTIILPCGKELDNDFDLVLGTATDGVSIYWNIGNQENHQFIKDSCLDVPYFGYNIKPSIVDVDNSGSLDIIVGVSTGGFLHYKMSRFSDLNYDNNIDISDIIIIVSEILHSNDDEIICVADANHDGNLDIFDIVLIVGNILNF